MKVKKNPNEIIGKKYDKYNYHCWHFIEECLDVPSLADISVATAVGDIAKYKDAYYEIDTPADFCGVLLGENHVGIWFKNGVYHNDVGGVRYEPMRVLKTKYKKVKFYDIH